MTINRTSTAGMNVVYVLIFGLLLFAGYMIWRDAKTEPLEKDFRADIYPEDLSVLRKQLAQCWSSAKRSENQAPDMPVEIRLIISPERQVLSSSVVDKVRYDTDQSFRAAADQALLTLTIPDCKTLDLPPKAYEKWKDMIVNFDPRDML